MVTAGNNMFTVRPVIDRLLDAMSSFNTFQCWTGPWTRRQVARIIECRQVQTKRLDSTGHQQWSVYIYTHSIMAYCMDATFEC